MPCLLVNPDLFPCIYLTRKLRRVFVFPSIVSISFCNRLKSKAGEAWEYQSRGKRRNRLFFVTLPNFVKKGDGSDIRFLPRNEEAFLSEGKSSICSLFFNRMFMMLKWMVLLVGRERERERRVKLVSSMQRRKVKRNLILVYMTCYFVFLDCLAPNLPSLPSQW